MFKVEQCLFVARLIFVARLFFVDTCILGTSTPAGSAGAARARSTSGSADPNNLMQQLLASFNQPGGASNVGGASAVAANNNTGEAQTPAPTTADSNNPPGAPTRNPATIDFSNILQSASQAAAPGSGNQLSQEDIQRALSRYGP